ncbi:MAG: hypothetical protein IGR93_21230 [Hydrococcus sp. C42_A2020_068]|nr:hypothetical protein [Hydrococcus sp. C42_A2020_068]
MSNLQNWAKSDRLLKFKYEFPFAFDVSIYGLIFSLVSILVTGYRVHTENQALQIPLVHYINDPSLYPNDPFGQTLPYYASAVWYLVALGNRIFPLEPLLFSLFVLERLLVIFAAGYTAKTFAPHSKLAIIGAMALIALGLEGPTLGGNALVINYFEQTGLSIPFFLLAFAAFYQQNPWLVALWTALGFNCNSMYGAYALSYLGAAFLLDFNYLRNWKKWLLGFLLFLLLASPGILLTLSAFGREAADKDLWYLVSKVRFPHHLFPLTWNKIEFGKYGAIAALVLAFLYQNCDRFRQLSKLCNIWTGVSFLWLIYAFVAAYVTKSPSMLVMHPGRAITLWYGIAAIALVSAFAVKLETTKGTTRRAFWVIMLSASFLIWYPIVGPFILAVALIAIAIHPVWYYILGRGSSSRIALLLSLWVVFVGITSLQERWGKGQSLASAIIYRPSATIEEIANWAQKNTSTDSVFLAEFGLGWQQFRGQSKRPVYMNWKDGSAILWDRTFVTPWVERLKAVGFDITEKGLNLNKSMKKLDDLYKNLRDEDVAKLKSRYKLDYWVISNEKASQFPTAFENQAFKVLNLNERQAG